MVSNNLKPVKRSKLRLAVGKRYFTYKRFIYWMKHAKKMTKTYKCNNLEHLIFEHKTPLRRPLKNVDSYLNDNKIINLKVAIEKIDGILLKPEELFSYWQLIGNPTSSKGYVDGMVLDHGNYKLGVGGGLCQLSNLLYWMVLHTPIGVVERHRHSYDVFPDASRTQPFGSGATCVYNYRDLQLNNNTNETYQIKLRLDEDYLYGEIFADRPKYFDYEVYEASHSITQAYWGGYIRHNSIERRVIDINGSLIERQKVCENHALMMYSPLLNPPTALNNDSDEVYK